MLQKVEDAILRGEFSCWCKNIVDIILLGKSLIRWLKKSIVLDEEGEIIFMTMDVGWGWSCWTQLYGWKGDLIFKLHLMFGLFIAFKFLW